jgi:hypothetical protein
LPADRQRILFSGRQFDNDAISLMDAGIAKVLHFLEDYGMF